MPIKLIDNNGIILINKFSEFISQIPTLKFEIDNYISTLLKNQWFSPTLASFSFDEDSIKVSVKGYYVKSTKKLCEEFLKFLGKDINITINIES